jgi:hypothetical protein
MFSEPGADIETCGLKAVIEERQTAISDSSDPAATTIKRSLSRMPMKIHTVEEIPG